MIERRDTFELAECSLPVSAIIQEMAEVDSGFMEIGIEAEGPPDLTPGPYLLAKPMECVAKRGRDLRAVGTGGGGLGEHIPAFGVKAFAIERPPHRQHQLHVVLEPQRGDSLEQCERGVTLPEAEQCLA